MQKNKKKVGVYSFTCDEGCSIYLIEIFNKKLLEWLNKIELAYFLSVRDHREVHDFDIVLVEGVITSESDFKKIKHIRENTKFLIAMGTCSITGQPSGQRNNFNEIQHSEIKEKLESGGYLPKVLTLGEVVKIDDKIQGCPIMEEQFINVFEKYIN